MNVCSKFYLLIVYFFFLSEMNGQCILPDPLSTSNPTFQTASNPLKPTSLWGKAIPPYPTNYFWTNVVLENGNTRINTFPYQLEVTSTGFDICFPSPSVSQSNIVTAFNKDISIEIVEPLPTHYLSSYDLLSFSLVWQQILTSYIVRGSPYISVIVGNKTPVFKTIHAITSVNGKTSGSLTDSKFVVTMNNGQTWIIYTFPKNITLSISGTQLLASEPYAGILRVAYSPNPQVESALDNSKQAIPISGDVSYVVDGDKATLVFSWASFGKLPIPQNLMIALPHHMDSFVNKTVVVSNAYKTLRGPVSFIRGDVWYLKEQLTNISWFARSPIPNDKRNAILEALKNDQNKKVGASDPYFFGKEIASLGRLALIADQLGSSDIATSIRTNMKNYLNPWLSDKNGDRLLYDTDWGGICSKNGLANSGADFGNGIYNDHHFHYGYFIYAAAVIAKEDPAWASTYSETITDFVRELANPCSKDSHFPVTRHKDWFAGNSWASGLTAFGDSKNQESTSEAINAYYAIYLWGLATKNSIIKDLGRVLLATEIRSAQKYWHIPSTSNVYPAPFSNNKMVGIVWETKVDYATWFGGLVEFIHCIQMLPFTPITEEYLPSTFINEEYPVLATALNRPSPPIDEGWKGFIYMAHAIINSEKAWNEVQTLRSYDDGNSQTNTLYWVATRP